MARVTVHTVCTATVNETWEVEVPEGLDWLDPLDLLDGTHEGVEILSCQDEVTGEHDREVLSFAAGGVA